MEKMLKDWDAKSLTEIAKVKGIGQPRVSQIMNLLNLPPKVQEFLLKLEDPEEIRKYSERRLREFMICEGGQGKTRISVKKLREFIAEKEARSFWKKPGKHIIHQAIQWREMLESGEVKSLTEIAKKARLTRARVTQIMNLLKLPSEVQDFLISLDDPREISKYSEKRLRVDLSSVEDILKCSTDAVSGMSSREPEISA